MSEFESFLTELYPRVDRALDHLLPAATERPERLHEALRYSVFAGGKRIRPALVALTGEILEVPLDALLTGGAALELIHTYSLIHDDLPALDNDDLRRGRPTLHRQYGEATAILAGDSLLTLGLASLASQPREISAEQRRLAVETVGRAIGSVGMIGGQFDDLAAESAWPEDAASTLERIHRLKTGALLVACIQLAAIYGNVAPDLYLRLTGIGEKIGLMFQITDDILDVEGTSGALGKTAGKDAATRKLTYPGLFGLEESKRLLERNREEALASIRELPRGGGLFPSLIGYLTTRDR